MQQISLHQVLPQVFAQRVGLTSDVWKKEVCFEKGNVYLVEAKSGKGKSTFCSYLLGYRHDYTGQICYDAEDIRDFSVSQWVDIRQRQVSMLFQEMRLFPELTALENVELKNRITHFKTRQQIELLFDALGIADKLHSPVARLSIGQQQRVAVIRTLCQPADFILLDEPVSHLDETNNQIVAQLVTDEAARQGAGIIATSVGNHLKLNDTQHLAL